jgi:predicted kinase
VAQSACLFPLCGLPHSDGGALLSRSSLGLVWKSAVVVRVPTLFVMVGLPGSGKTRLAIEVEQAEHALRLTPDEWMVPLFGALEEGDARDVLEGRFVWLARRALLGGLDVVLDFGVWSKDERTALRHIAAGVGARCRLVFADVGATEQRQRLDARTAGSPGTSPAISDNDLVRARNVFQVPDRFELADGPLDPPPAGHATWEDWAAQRWPTSTG